MAARSIVSSPPDSAAGGPDVVAFSSGRVSAGAMDSVTDMS
jgi:hypothetical protein